MTSGKFSIKLPEIDDDESEKVNFAPGSLFNQREKIADKEKSIKEPPKNDGLSKNSNDGDAKKRQEKPKNVIKTQKNEKVEKHGKITSENGEKVEKSKENAGKATEKPSEKTGQTSEKPQKPAKSDVPFEKLMSGVTFVLSGFENPFRSQLRDKALQMGARYAPDWSKGCTHLVCAFPDTPKYNQVKKMHGQIVKKEWILDSFKEERLLDWKHYAFEKSDKIDDEDDKKDIPKDQGKQRSTKIEAKRKIADAADEEKSQSPPPSAKKTKNESDDDSWIYDAPTDESDDDVTMDTDDEIEPSQSKRKEKSSKNAEKSHKNLPKNSSRAKNDYEDFEFDDENQQPCSSKSLKVLAAKKKDGDFNGSNLSANSSGGSDLPVDEDGLPILPDFFSGFHFLIYESKQKISQAERKQLNRYIVAFDGRLEPYMSPAVSHVISRDRWDQAFDEASAENPNLVFVKTDWVLECGRKERLIDPKPYLITK